MEQITVYSGEKRNVWVRGSEGGLIPQVNHPQQQTESEQQTECRQVEWVEGVFVVSPTMMDGLAEVAKVHHSVLKTD